MSPRCTTTSARGGRRTVRLAPCPCTGSTVTLAPSSVPPELASASTPWARPPGALVASGQYQADDSEEAGPAAGSRRGRAAAALAGAGPRRADRSATPANTRSEPSTNSAGSRRAGLPPLLDHSGPGGALTATPGPRPLPPGPGARVGAQADGWGRTEQPGGPATSSTGGAGPGSRREPPAPARPAASAKCGTTGSLLRAGSR